MIIVQYFHNLGEVTVFIFAIQKFECLKLYLSFNTQCVIDLLSVVKQIFFYNNKKCLVGIPCVEASNRYQI